MLTIGHRKHLPLRYGNLYYFLTAIFWNTQYMLRAYVIASFRPLLVSPPFLSSQMEQTHTTLKSATVRSMHNSIAMPRACTAEQWCT